jgi:hypothetical protein
MPISIPTPVEGELDGRVALIVGELDVLTAWQRRRRAAGRRVVGPIGSIRTPSDGGILVDLGMQGHIRPPSSAVPRNALSDWRENADVHDGAICAASITGQAAGMLSCTPWNEMVFSWTATTDVLPAGPEVGG